MINKISFRVFYLWTVVAAINLGAVNPVYSLNTSSTVEPTVNSNVNEETKPSFDRKQYGQHSDCFTWQDNSALDGGQQEIDGYCNLEGITPQLEFNESTPDVHISEDVKRQIEQQIQSSVNLEAEKDSSSSSVKIRVISEAKKQEAQEKTANVKKTVKLPGFLDAFEYNGLDSSLDKSSSFIPIPWVMGMVFTLSLGLTVFWEQK